MEIWGGNRAVDTTVSLTGLDVRAFSRVFGDSDRGGDVLYVSSCASGRISRVLLADVSGHGAQVSPLGERLRELMRRNVNRVDQARLVTSVNRAFAEVEPSAGFATAVVVTFYQPTRSLAVSIAGHPRPLIYRREPGVWSVVNEPDRVGLKEAGLPLGISSAAQYEVLESGLHPGDLLFCYTDAFTEALGPEGKILGTDGLLAIVSELPTGEPDRFLPRLVERIEAFDSRNLKTDDATAVLITPNGRWVTLKDNLLAPLRWLRGQLGNEPREPWHPECELRSSSS
jgi:serine phosphatase RsbU (regulator of sigma subunit)